MPTKIASFQFFIKKKKKGYICPKNYEWIEMQNSEEG